MLIGDAVKLLADGGVDADVGDVGGIALRAVFFGQEESLELLIVSLGVLFAAIPVGVGIAESQADDQADE